MSHTHIPSTHSPCLQWLFCRSSRGVEIFSGFTGGTCSMAWCAAADIPCVVHYATPRPLECFCTWLRVASCAEVTPLLTLCFCVYSSWRFHSVLRVVVCGLHVSAEPCNMVSCKHLKWNGCVQLWLFGYAQGGHGYRCMQHHVCTKTG